MWSAIVRVLAGFLTLANKFIPSREWKGGRAEANVQRLKETKDAQKRMDAVPAPDERDTVDRLRKGDF